MLEPPTPARESSAWKHVPSQPLSNHRFRGSQPRLTPRSAVGFFGFGGCSGHPDRTDHPAYFGAATRGGRPFLPSMKAVSWLRPSRQLLRESQRRGGMYPTASRDHRFRGSRSRLTPRSAVGFFGSGGCSGRPDRTDHPAYFGAATFCCCPFLPSTKANVRHDEKMSTPKVCAIASYLCVRIFGCKRQNSAGFAICHARNSMPVHIFFTGTAYGKCRKSECASAGSVGSIDLGGVRLQGLLETRSGGLVGLKSASPKTKAKGLSARLKAVP